MNENPSSPIGQRIVDIRPMKKHEQKAEGWCNGTLVIVLGDGTKIYPSQDEEGNGPGALFVCRNGKTYCWA